MVMIDGHGNLYGLWIQICHCILEKQLQWLVYKKSNVTRHLWSPKRALKFRRRKLYF